MMGLLKEMGADDWSFEQKSSIPELYTEFSRLILSRINTGRHWWKYVNTSFTFKRRAALPSWVPDLHFLSHEHSCGRCFISELPRDGNSEFQASACSTVFVSGLHANEIQLQAKILDEVILVHPGPPSMPELDEGLAVEAIVNLEEWERTFTDTMLENPWHGIAESHCHFTKCWHVTEDTYLQTLMAGNTFDERTGAHLTLESLHDFRKIIGELARGIKG